MRSQPAENWWSNKKQQEAVSRKQVCRMNWRTFSSLALQDSLRLQEKMKQSKTLASFWDFCSCLKAEIFLTAPDLSPISPPSRCSRHWAGSEVGAGTGWGSAGPRPGSTPRLRWRPRPSEPSGPHSSGPSRRVTWRVWSRGGCGTSPTSDASFPAERRRSAATEHQACLMASMFRLSETTENNHPEFRVNKHPASVLQTQNLFCFNNPKDRLPADLWWWE